MDKDKCSCASEKKKYPPRSFLTRKALANTEVFRNPYYSMYMFVSDREA